MTIGRFRGTQAVWLLSALIAAAVAACLVFVLPTLAPIPAPQRVPWWALALGFAAAELGAIRLYFRRSVSSFTMGDVVLVVGLLVAEPRDLVIALALGPALVLVWRQTPLKLVFNVGHYALSGCVALIVFHAVPVTDLTGPGAWGAALAATVTAGITGLVLLTAAISMAEGRVQWRDIALMVQMDSLATISMTCIGLALATLVILDARSAWLLLLPAALLVLTYRAYLSERQRRERLDFLYDATHALSLSSDVEVALRDMLIRCRDAFRVELAEVVLLPAGGVAPRRSRVCPRESAAMTVVEPDSHAVLRSLAAASEAVRCVQRPAADPAVERYLRSSGAHGPALIAVLRAEGRPLGLVMMANRPAVDRGFGAADLELLEKLARHVAASLEHDSLERDFGRMEQLQGELEHLAFHDPLTGLANRARFIDQVRHSLAHRDALVAALFIDLDDFKTVNDSLGHKAGDELLLAVADRLRGCLRPHDTPARLGGDEFAVLIDRAEGMEVVIEIAERVLESLDEPFQVADTELAVRASIGVATSREGIRRADDLVRNADLAMYRAKSQGKGCIELFEPEMHTRAVKRHELKAELQRAVQENEFVVLFQPVVDLHSGQIVGVEALARWQHPRLGLVAPDVFIALAEEAGLIDAIGRRVFARACERLAAWRRASIAGDEFSLSLNLSAREFQNADLVESLRLAAVAAGVPTSAITLEITESALTDDLESAVARMELVKAGGFRLALDDFGKGHSSLGHLRRFPFDVLKIAKPLVDDIADRAQDADFLRSILDLARTLALEVIVEGVETPEQAQVLLGLGVRKVQGFVFSRPVEDRALSALLTLTPLRGFADAAPVEAAPGDLVEELIAAERRW